jgi:NAD-dependent SIR2 family protein deacetylase
MFRQHKTFIIFSFLILASLSLHAYGQSDYFSTARFCSSEELHQELKDKTLDMAWHFGEDSHFRFVSKDDEVYFEIYLGTLPDIYSDFISQVKNSFVEAPIGEPQRIVFSYRVNTEGRKEMNVPQQFHRRLHPDEDSYLLTGRRVIEDAMPLWIDEEELSTIIKNHSVLFYTGAGLSLASNVPAMNELQSLLGLEKGENFLFSLRNAIENPEELASKIFGFRKACFSSAPTKAHFALKELATLKNIRLITENLDCLHEASGVYPYRIDAKHLRDEVGAESLAQFDYIICVGLSYDDRGFLAWYKKHNPKGKIIAIDLQQPSYLGDEDFLLVGDLQEVIASIEYEVVNE